MEISTKYQLRLFVIGHSLASALAQEHLRTSCEGELQDWRELKS